MFLSGVMNLFNIGASAFTETQVTEITTALSTSVGTVVDTFVDSLPIIAVIVGALWGIRFILHTFGKIY